MNYDLETQQEKLTSQQQIVLSAIREYATNHPVEVAAFEKTNLERIVNRLFDAEIDYLLRNTEEYFELYKDEL